MSHNTMFGNRVTDTAKRNSHYIIQRTHAPLAGLQAIILPQQEDQVPPTARPRPPTTQLLGERA